MKNDPRNGGFRLFLGLVVCVRVYVAVCWTQWPRQWRAGMRRACIDLPTFDIALPTPTLFKPTTLQSLHTDFTMLSGGAIAKHKHRYFTQFGYSTQPKRVEKICRMQCGSAVSWHVVVLSILQHICIASQVSWPELYCVKIYLQGLMRIGFAWSAYIV